MKLLRETLGIVAAVLLLGVLDPAVAAAPDRDVNNRLDRAAKLFEKEDYGAARLEYERAVQQDPGSIPAWRGLGWSLWRLGEQQRALKIWMDLLKVQPNEPEILLALAEAHEQQEVWSESLEFYEKLLRSGRHVREARLGRARVFRSLRKYREAEAEIRSVLSTAPADFDAQFLLASVYMDTSRGQEAVSLLKLLVARNPEFKTIRALADVASEVGDFEESIRQYRRALKQRPNERGTVIGLYRAFARSQRHTDAMALLKSYLAAQPGDDEIREQLGRTAAMTGDHPEAERQWRTLLTKHPDDLKWALHLANVFHAQDRFDEASKLAHWILTRDPKNGSALGLLADDAIFGRREEEAMAWLQRLVVVEPTVLRLNQLANLHLSRGARHALDGEDDAAERDYVAAYEAFTRGRTLDPTDSEATMGAVTALRLRGLPKEAVASAEQVRSQHPRLERAFSELQLGYMDLGDPSRASAYLASLQRQFPKDVRLDREQARTLFFGGEKEKAVETAERTLRRPLRPNVPVLLYHGITTSRRVNATPADGFADQMRALRQAGYQSITVQDLVGFLSGTNSLPSKPILITFDDARTDTFHNADPVLRETGFNAAMFIPVAEVNRHIAFYAPWNLVRQMAENGRWEIQCHGFDAHRKMPINAEGTKGTFLANRLWLEAEKRLETEEEYMSRIERDYEQCREALMREIGHDDVIAYAFPFGDLGHKSLSNVPDAFDRNLRILSRHFRIAFIEEPAGFVTPESSPLLLPRFEVPREYLGSDLLRYLRTTEPKIATSFLLADFYVWTGRYADAMAIYEGLGREGTHRPTLLERRSQVYTGKGDFSGARAELEAANAEQRQQRLANVYPEEIRIAKALDTLDTRIRPILQFEGGSYLDNDNRINASFSPSGRVYLNDRFSLIARYKLTSFQQSDFELQDSGSSSSASPDSSGGGGDQTSSGTGETPAGISASGGGSSAGVAQSPEEPSMQTASPELVTLRAGGNEAEIQLDYRRDWGTGFSLSAGAADFTNRSSPRVFGTPDPEPLLSGLFTFGMGDHADLSLGGSHGYVSSAGAILDDLDYSASIARLRVWPFRWLTLSARHAFTYYSDRNRRNTAFGAALGRVWETPSLQLGYQFTYDDALRRNPFFFTPDRFTANEGVAVLEWKPTRTLTTSTTVTGGLGQQRGGNPVPQASVLAALQLQLGRHFGLFGGVGRSQSAKFQSVLGNGGVLIRF